jgi:hypothetical protein
MNQPEPNDAQDMSNIDLEGLIFGSDYLDDPNFLALPAEVREAWIDADRNGQLFSVEDEMLPHNSVQKQRDLDRQQWNSFNKELEDRTEEYINFSRSEEEFLNELHENQVRELEKSNNSCKSEEEILNEFYENQVRELEESNRHILEDLAPGEHIQSETKNFINSFQPHFEDKVTIINTSHLEDKNTSIKISLKLNNKHDVNNIPLGTQSLHVPHIDRTKLDALKGFYLFYGDIQCIYRFDSGREIKVYVKDKNEGFRVINKLLKVVRSEQRKGNAQKHCKFKEVKRNKKHGTKGTFKCLHIIDSTGKN